MHLRTDMFNFSPSLRLSMQCLVGLRALALALLWTILPIEANWVARRPCVRSVKPFGPLVLRGLRFCICTARFGRLNFSYDI